MKEHFVIYVFFVILFFNDCKACFKEDTVANYSITSTSGFYTDCCCVEKGFTTANLTWLGPDNNLIGPAGADSNVYIQYNEDEEGNKCISLVALSASVTLSGTYKCVTSYNGVPHYQIHHLDVYNPLYFIDTSPKQYLVHHRDSRINCTARGASPPQFRWSRGKDGEQEITESEKYGFLPEGLLVRNVSDEDAGIYKCTALVLSTSEEVELDIDVEIMTVPQITQLRASPEQIVTVGEFLRIECIAEGFPKPEHKWRKISASKPSNETRNVTWHQEFYAISFDSIQAEDGGIYECYVQNFAGNNSDSIEIKVLVPPTITKFSNETVVEGDEIAIQCIANGNPTPNITITFEGKSWEEEKSSIYDQVIDNFSLLKVDRSKEGFYICNASNEVDFTTETMYLTVLHPPYFKNKYETVWGWNGEYVELSCENEANPRAQVTWRYDKYENLDIDEAFVYQELRSKEVKESQKYSLNVTEDFAPYGIYGCVAQNYLGQASKFMAFKKGFVPAEVINSSLADVTATSATFELQSPFNFEGPEVLGFKAEYDFAENYDITNIHRNRTWATDRTFKLDKLRPNSTYYIRFAALNRVGAGPWGEGFTFETLEKSAPEPPIWQVDSPQFPPNNVLKWKAPEDNGDPIDFYALRYCPALEDLEESLCKEQRIEDATEHEITDLEFNTTYNFELIAHNVNGYSTAANISLSVPVPIVAAEPLLSEGAIIGISIVLVFVCLIILDLLFLFWKQQGIIASCCCKKSKKKPNPLNSRDKKGLLKDNGENTDDTLRRHNNGHKEYEYNKTTGIITGKHSSV